MKEGIAARVGRIISGSVNSMVDAVENVAPEIVMEQAVREVDDVVGEVRAELGKVVAAKHVANRRLMQANEEHDALLEKIDLAINEGRDDLAEAAISRQLDLEAQIPILEATIRDNGEREAELERYVEALKAKRREMKEELHRFREAKATAAVDELTGGGEVAPDGSSSIESKLERAQGAFDRVLEKQTGVPGASHAGLKDASKLAELEEMSRSNQIAQRLASIKARKSEQ